MKSFASVIAFSAAVAGFVAATPAVESRTSCKGNQFWFPQLGCCLDHGGPSTPPTPPRSRDCPKDTWYWNNKQGCCTPRHEAPPEPSCKSNYSWSKGSWCCEENPTPSTSSTPAQPSKTPTQPGYGGGSQPGYGNGNSGGNYGGNYGGHKKRSHSRNASLCPTGLTACPVAGATSYNKSSDYECVDHLEDLNSCGGCAVTGEGQDCSAIAHSWNVGCVSGSCEVFTCAPGYAVSFDAKTCIQL